MSPLFHRCLGQNDVTAGEGEGCSGVLASFEKMKMRPPDAGKSVDKAGRQTFDGEQPPV